MTSTENNPYDIPSQRPPSEEQSLTPPPAAPPEVQWPTVGFGTLATVAWVLGMKLWGLSTIPDLGLAVFALLFVFWVSAMPVYLIAAKALADKEITGNELRAMSNWPTEFALLAMSGGNLRDNDGNRQFAPQIDRKNDNSRTIARGFGAYTLVFGLFGVALAATVGLVYLTLGVIPSLIILAFFTYTGGMLFYFWTCGLTRQQPSGKLLSTLLFYPWDAFRKILGA